LCDTLHEIQDLDLCKSIALKQNVKELRTDFCLTLKELKLAEQMEPEFGTAVLISDRVLQLKLEVQR